HARRAGVPVIAELTAGGAAGELARVVDLPPREGRSIMRDRSVSVLDVGLPTESTRERTVRAKGAGREEVYGTRASSRATSEATSHASRRFEGRHDGRRSGQREPPDDDAFVGHRGHSTPSPTARSSGCRRS